MKKEAAIKDLKIYPENSKSHFAEMFGFKLEKGFDFGDLIWFLEYNLGYEVGSEKIPFEVWDKVNTIAEATDNFRFNGGYFKYVIIN